MEKGTGPYLIGTLKLPSDYMHSKTLSLLRGKGYLVIRENGVRNMRPLNLALYVRDSPIPERLWT